MTVVGTGLAEIGGDASTRVDGGSDGVERLARASRCGHKVDIIEEGSEALAGAQLLVCSDEGVVLPEGVQRRCEGVTLLTALALMDGAPLPVGVPPEIGGLLPVPQAHEREKRGGNGMQFVQESSAGDRVVGAAAVERHDGGRRVEIDSGAKHTGKCVCTCSCLQSKLVRAGGFVKRIGIGPGETARDETPECVSSSDAAHSSAGLAERGQTGQADGDGDVRWDARGGEEVGGVHEQLERLGIVEQQLVMLARGARQPSSGAAPGGPQGLGNGIVSKHDGRGRLEGEESGGHVSQGCRRAPLGVGQGCKRVIRTRATAAEVRVPRARETSPRRTLAQAAARRPSRLASPSAASAEASASRERGGAAAARAALSRASHRPVRKSRVRCKSASRPAVPGSRARWSSRRGASKNSFHARIC